MKLTNTLILCPLVLGFHFSSYGHDHNKKPPAATPAHTKKSIDFIENKGQWDVQARFRADVPGGAMFLTDKGFVYNYASAKDLERVHDIACGPNSGKQNVRDEIIRQHAYKVNFVGAGSKVTYATTDKRSYYNNYFIGNDASHWAGNVGLFGKVTQQNIYNGVDVVVYSKGADAIKYDFVVAPGADPAQIALSFEGVNPQITKDGNLLIKTSVNEITEKAPYTYQVIDGRTVPVVSKYKLTKGILTFELPNSYNKAYPLIIDPDLVFATYSGSTGTQSFYSVSTTYDVAGSLYAGSQAYGVGWPVSAGAFQGTFGGGQDASINKYSPDGVTLIYSTYYGGSGVDLPHAMIVNPDNELIIAGSTESTNLATTAGAYDVTHNGNRDIFVARFNATGTALLGATYVGTSQDDANTFSATALTTFVTGQNTSSPTEVNFDEDGNIWVVSSTPANNFPVTANAAQATSGGSTDGVLFQLNPDCSNLMYSTYLGGSGNDVIFGIQFNSLGNAVVCGTTQSTNFPTTSGVLHSTAPGGLDGFVTMINTTSGALMRSTYLGTTATDQAVNLQVDCADNIYVLGRTQGNYPISAGVYSMANSDLFIDKLSPDLGSSLLSTRVGYAQGGNPQFFPTAFVLDICGNVYVAGLTSSGGSVVPGMPLTPDAFSTIPDNFYFLALESGFSNLLFATYFGLQNWDDHTHVGIHRLDPSGIVYHSICCNGSGWPTAPSNVYCPNKLNSSGQDIVSFKFNFDAINIDLDEQTTEGGLDTNAHCVRGCKSAFIDFSRSGDISEDLNIKYIISGSAVNGVDYQLITDEIMIPANQSVAVLEIKPLLVPNPTGVKEVIIQALSPCGCEDGSNNIVREARVLIYDSLYVAILTPLDTICPNTQITITAEIDTTLDFRWVPAALSQGSLTITPTPTRTQTYSIIGTQPGAPATCPPRQIDYEIFVEPMPVINLQPRDVTMCASDSADLNAYAGPPGTNYIYNWSPPDYLRDDYSPNNKFFGPVGEYKKIITVNTPVANCTSKDSMFIHVMPPFSFQSVSPVDTTILYGDTIRLNSESTAVMWLWTPGTYLDDPLLKNPLARPLESMTYHLVGYDENGCRDTAEVHINVEYGTKVGVPNAFSPNGDGLNDEFKIANVFFEKLVEFKVWNRYGQLVFETKDPKKGWDGTIKGQPGEMDAYFYMIQVAMPDGTPKTFKGDVTLIR